ncbi:MAG TPA: DUF5317 domain-containing protein [Actinomycetota bacterium]|nr:DUF5317 domain-containing protein [Actinomycetota bacterium]
MAALVLGVLTVPLLGGRLARLAEIEIRALWAVAAAIGIQFAIISIFPDSFENLHVPLHFISYLFAGLFVWMNRRIPGMLIIGLGAALNLIAITANGGVMPATPAALRSAGITETEGFVNSTSVQDPKLQFLGDIWAIPDSVPILDNVFSIGDVLIAIGIVVLVHGVCGSKLVPERWRGTPSGAESAVSEPDAPVDGERELHPAPDGREAR